MWSKRNVDKVAALTAEGRMRHGGRAEVDRAKADGRWERAYAGSSGMEVSAELQAALDGNVRAREAFERLTKGQRYPMLLRLQTAKKEETKMRIIGEYVATLASGEEVE